MINYNNNQETFNIPNYISVHDDHAMDRQSSSASVIGPALLISMTLTFS